MEFLEYNIWEACARQGVQMGQYFLILNYTQLFMTYSEKPDQRRREFKFSDYGSMLRFDHPGLGLE